MKMYGSYSDEDLNNWQQFPLVASVLTSSLFGAWLMRRDENKAKQFPTIPLDKVKQAREEIEDRIDNYPDRNISEYEDCLAILDKLIESEEK